MSFQGPGYPGAPQGQPDQYGTPQQDDYTGYRTSYEQPQSYEQYPSYEQPQSYEQPPPYQQQGYEQQGYDQQGYDQYGRYGQPPADGYAQSSGPPAQSAPPAPGYPPAPGQPAPPYGQPWAPPQPAQGVSGGAIAAIVGGGLVLLLVLVVGGVWLATRDDGTAPPTAGGSPGATQPAGAGGLQLAGSSTAEGLFAAQLEPPDHPKYKRVQVGETDCVTVAAGEESKHTISEIGCKKAYLALYVSEDKKYAVTVGYLDVGSKSAAKDGSAEKYGDYSEYNSWFKFLIPEGSKITGETRIFTYVSASEQYVTYGTGAYYDGKDAEEGMDDTLMEEAIGVGVAVMFA